MCIVQENSRNEGTGMVLLSQTEIDHTTKAYVDSGASAHMFNSISLFEKITNRNNMKAIEYAVYRENNKMEADDKIITILQVCLLYCIKKFYRIDGILGTNSSPPQALSRACRTKATPSSRVILNRVIFSSVIGNTPDFRFSKKNGTTEPRDPNTLP